jgi:hypothetical protein
MGINKLNLLIIDNINSTENINIDNYSTIQLIELGTQNFLDLLSNSNIKFQDYNKDTLYIFKNSSYADIKLLFRNINDYTINIGRGGGQKYHMVSPLELKMSCYLMALFNFDYLKLSKLNTFNYVPKFRYLPSFNKK